MISGVSIVFKEFKNCSDGFHRIQSGLQGLETGLKGLLNKSEKGSEGFFVFQKQIKG